MRPTVPYLPALCVFLIFLITGCQKDKIEVDVVKEYIEVDHIPTHPFDGGLHLILKPDGVAELNPVGDIVYRGRYTIRGARINVNIEDHSESYIFEILSQTQIREQKSGTVLH